MSRAAFFTAAVAGGSIAALCFCWTARFLRNKKTPSPSHNLPSGASLPAASKVVLSLAEEPAPEPTSLPVEDIIDEANLLETHEGYEAELKAQEASDFLVVEVSLESFHGAGESHSEEVEVVQKIEVEDWETKPKAADASVTAVMDASHESSNGVEDSETEQEEEMVVHDAIEGGQEECLDGGRDPEAEEEDAGGEGEEVVEDGKLVEVSGWDCLVGGIGFVDERVVLSEECGGEAVKGDESDGVPYQDASLVDWGDSEVAEGDAVEGCVDVANDGMSVHAGDRYLANGDEGENQNEDFKEVHQVGLSLVQEPAPVPASPLVQDIYPKDEAIVLEIPVELETHEGYQTELKAEASDFVLVEVSLESFHGAGESHAEKEEEVVQEIEVEDPETEPKDGKLVEVSGLDCLVGGVDSEEKRVFLSEECGGDAGKGSETDGMPYRDTGLVDSGDSEVAEGDAIEGCVDVAKDGESVDVGDHYVANGDEGDKQDEDFKEEVHHEEVKEHLNEEVKEHLKSNELEVPIEGPTTEARLVMEVVNGTIFYMDPITKNNRGFSLLRFTTLDEAKQELSMLKNSLVNDTPYRVAHNHTEASLVEVVNQTIFYTDPVTKKNNGFSLLQFSTLDKAERGVTFFMNQLGNGTPCAPTSKQDREPQDGEPEEEILMDMSNRGGRFPPPEQIHGLKPPRASRHVTQRGSGISSGGF